jgi:two-component system NtrC family sensor kinase
LKYHVTVDKRLEADLNSVKADSQQMDQVLVNLFVNSADAIDIDKEGHIVVETFNDGKWVIVRITDNGSGISEDKIDEIWKPFYTTKTVDKGTGLGLYTVRGIIENHGGDIEAHNAEGGGAVFEFRLPGIV